MSDHLISSDLYFSIHSQAEYYGDKPGEYNVIVFCPKDYWEEKQCLPDYFFADKMEAIEFPPEYWHYQFAEETMWCSTKSEEEIRTDLTKIGFVENQAMKTFLDSCWY